MECKILDGFRVYGIELGLGRGFSFQSGESSITLCPCIIACLPSIIRLYVTECHACFRRISSSGQWRMGNATLSNRVCVCVCVCVCGGGGGGGGGLSGNVDLPAGVKTGWAVILARPSDAQLCAFGQQQ